MASRLEDTGPFDGGADYDGRESGTARRIDKQVLRCEYAEEPDERLWLDRNRHYLRPTGDRAHYLDDPYTPWTEREPRTNHRTVVCLGGGFAGLAYAHESRQRQGTDLPCKR